MWLGGGAHAGGGQCHGEARHCQCCWLAMVHWFLKCAQAQETVGSCRKMTYTVHMRRQFVPKSLIPSNVVFRTRRDGDNNFGWQSLCNDLGWEGCISCMGFPSYMIRRNPHAKGSAGFADDLGRRRFRERSPVLLQIQQTKPSLVGELNKAYNLPELTRTRRDIQTAPQRFPRPPSPNERNPQLETK